MELQKHFLIGARTILLLLCIYGATDFSINPKQKENKDVYYDLRFFYFTNISLYCTIITSIISIIHRSSARLSGLLHFMLSTSPIFNSVTASTFWTLYFIDKKMIVSKKSLEPGCETYILTELSIHLFPIILSFLEQIDVRLTKSNAYYGLFAIIVVLYATLTYILNAIVGKFLYPFLENISTPKRMLFFITIFCLCMLFYNMLIFINRRCVNKI